MKQMLISHGDGRGSNSSSSSSKMMATTAKTTKLL